MWYFDFWDGIREKKMRWIKYVGMIILISVMVYTFLFHQNETRKEQKKKIEIKLYEQNRIRNSDILGMIELVRTNKKSMIKKGNIEEIIAQNQVVSLNQKLDTSNTIYLAGHSIPSVFNDLHQSQIGDSIILTIQNKKYHYLIQDKKKVYTNDFSPLVYPYHNLVLITCTTNPQIRLLVFAELTED